jgi:hypothetical protein
LEDKRAEQVLLGGLVPVGGLWRWGKSVEGWIWCNCCAHMYVSGKMRLVETVPWMRGGGIKENGGRG